HTPEHKSITVAEAGALWIEKGQLGDEPLERSTLKQYRNHIRLHIVPLIGSVKLAKLTSPMVETFKADLLKKGTSQVMTRKVLGSLKSILREAQGRGLVAQNAALPVRVDKSKRGKRPMEAGRDFPSEDEAQTILSKAQGRWRPLLVTALLTGLR